MARNGKDVDSLVHKKATRKNIPTAEQQSFVEAEDAAPKSVTYPRDTPLEPGTTRPRNPDLDPQLVWRGKDQQDWSDLVVQAPPIYIQETIHPQAIIDDLRRRSEAARGEAAGAQFDFFNDFNGLPDEEAKLEFYQHDKHWANRMILGDSLQVMASLAEKEGLRGQVQCIYFDPPYGIKFNSNWQVSTRSRDVKDGKIDQISREPEQVKAFRDTWKDGIHSYMTYLRDRLTVARDLLTESGSIFVQIGDENVHRVRALMDEVFGEKNFISAITVSTTTSSSSQFIDNINDTIIWYSKSRDHTKYMGLFGQKSAFDGSDSLYRHVITADGIIYRNTLVSDVTSAKDPKVFRIDQLTSQTQASTTNYAVDFQGFSYDVGKRQWATPPSGMSRLIKASRVVVSGSSLAYCRMIDDYPVIPIRNIWSDTGTGSFTDPKVYVVQTNVKIIQRCILMTTDPGDIVLDPTCGSGTTAFVAEQWGRRWITIDTSRVALALARARLMGAKYPYYHLADSPDGLVKEAEASGTPPAQRTTYGDIRQGFVYRRVPHITLKSIANNAEIDVIWDRWQAVLEPLRHDLNAALGRNWQEWEIPRRPADPWPEAAQTLHAAIRKRLADGASVAPQLKKLNGLLKRDYTPETLPEFPDDPWTDAKAIDLHGRWWEARIARQQEIDKSIADKADQEFLYDKPYEDTDRVRVAGPFTVESLSPHRVLPTEEEELWEELVAADAVEAGRPEPRRTIGPPGAPARKKAPHQWEETDFATVMLDHLKTSGVHQGDKKDRITFTSLTPWPGEYVAADARYMEGDRERRAAIFIGPEFGTVSRPDLTAAAREARDAGFELLIACAFNFDAHASELAKMGPLQIVRARMNPDLHMADDLKNTGSGNLFVVFGEPDIEIRKEEDGELRVRILGLDIFDPQKGEVRAGGTDDIAAWFIDTDYDEESFFVRHAYFLGAQDPYKSLKTTLKAEIDEEAWESLYRDTSRPFPRPSSGRIAVKVINHFGDEVMKVYRV